jgi:hypothetical protein
VVVRDADAFSSRSGATISIMTEDTDLKTRFEAYCTTATTFEEVLSTLLVAAHGNDIDVSGAWEAYENGRSPEWDVVITLLERGKSPESGDEDGPSS